jgi:hypothetical protein
MTDDAHDVGLTVLINSIAHGLAVYGKAFIFLPLGFVPPLERLVEMGGID